MKISARLKISRTRNHNSDNEVMNITLHDDASGVEFFDGEIGLSDLMKALTGQADLRISADIRKLDKVGKKKERKPLSFPIPDKASWHQKEYAIEHAAEFCDPGWEPVLYFDSQSSFSHKDDKVTAHTHQVRWVDKQADDEECD